MKPDNIVINYTYSNRKPRTVDELFSNKDPILIDFGLSQKYLDDSEEKKHIKNETQPKAKGYPAFLSKNVLDK